MQVFCVFHSLIHLYLVSSLTLVRFICPVAIAPPASSASLCSKVEASIIENHTASIGGLRTDGWWEEGNGHLHRKRVLYEIIKAG